MSHGNYSDHEANLRNVREVARAAGRPIGVLADLQGPKIRLGRFAVRAGRRLVEGARFAITTDEVVRDGRAVLHDVQGLPG
jgi:pyruvate kinase